MKGERGEKLINKKLLGILAVALVAIIGSSVAWTMTWTSARITMTAGTASVVAIGIYQDCDTVVPFTTHNWDGVVNGQEYEVTGYVKNTGNQAVYITYTPGSYSSDGNQLRLRFNVSIIEGPATPCQLNPITPIYLQVKNPLVCETGFLLHPGKVIKIDIVMFVDSVVAGGTWSWNFYIEGCAP